MEPYRHIGKPVPRKEDPRLLVGGATYLADIKLSGALECVFIRSSLPRARIKRVAGPGQLYLWSDMAAEVGPLPPIVRPRGSLFPRITPLAQDEARFSGEPLAVLVGDEDASRYRLQDLAEQVEVDCEPLEPVFNVEQAASQGSPLVYPELGTNTLYSSRLVSGDVEAALSSSSTVVRRKMVFPANYGCAMEPRGVLAKYDWGDDTLTVWSSTQWPHFLRTLLSEVLDHPESKIRVIAPDVGGGFGNKQDLYREEVVVAWLAKKLRRPVRWVATRSEDVRSTVQSGLQLHNIELGLGPHGEIMALRDKICADLGSVGPMSLGPPVITQLSITGPYRVGAVEVELLCVATDKPPTGAYRGYGQQQAAYVVERVLEDAARGLGIHPLDLRLRNVVETFPYTTPTGRVLDSGNYAAMIETCRKLVENAEPPAGRLAGWGFAFGFESGGIGPVCVQESVGARHRGYDALRLRVESDGSVTIFTGLSPHGQGTDTALAQVCAEFLGVGLEEIRVSHGDTSSSPYGFGTWGSRGAVVGVGALLEAIALLKAKILEAASKLFDRSPSELEYVDGWVVLRRNGTRLASLKKIAQQVYSGLGGLDLEVSVKHEPKGLTVSGGLHAALVEVDPETGFIRILRYILVHDSGRAINPMIVEGQIVGGLVQGLGEALLEECEPEEGLLVSGLSDYLVPTALEAPQFEIHHLDTPSPLNQLGIKGVGESGIVGPAAAIANAAANALRLKDTSTIRVPLRPETLWKTKKPT